jgi:catechol 2,3-dioxygenase-like lactoylglutathione lyase family enzyme
VNPKNRVDLSLNVRGIAWVGVKTSRFEEMNHFVTHVMGLKLFAKDRDFRAFRLPNGDGFELFGPAGPDPPEQFARNKVVAGFLVDNIDQARQELVSSGIELIGALVRSEDGYAWQHFRAPDGNVYELTYNPAQLGKPSL